MRCLIYLVLALAPAFAQAAGSFEDRVRAYLLEHPEVILEALEILANREARAEMSARIAVHADLFDEPPMHGLGIPNAPIRVIEFFDYKCLPCKNIHPELVEFVRLNPNVRIEMLHLPILTPGSERGARFALAVRALEGDEAYARVHDAIWAEDGALTTRTFQTIAEAHGLDFSEIEDEMQSDAITARINRNRDIAVHLEILGTPAFLTHSAVTFGQSNVTDLAEIWLNP